MDTEDALEWFEKMETGIDKIWNVSDVNMPCLPNSIRDTRREVKLLSEGKCECCGKKGEHIHHRDRDRSNNKYINLIYLCKKCHYDVHVKMNKDPKFRAVRGVKINE